MTEGIVPPSIHALTANFQKVVKTEICSRKGKHKFIGDRKRPLSKRVLSAWVKFKVLPVPWGQETGEFCLYLNIEVRLLNPELMERISKCPGHCCVSLITKMWYSGGWQPSAGTCGRCSLCDVVWAKRNLGVKTLHCLKTRPIRISCAYVSWNNRTGNCNEMSFQRNKPTSGYDCQEAG